MRPCLTRAWTERADYCFFYMWLCGHESVAGKWLQIWNRQAENGLYVWSNLKNTKKKIHNVSGQANRCYLRYVKRRLSVQSDVQTQVWQNYAQDTRVSQKRAHGFKSGSASGKLSKAVTNAIRSDEWIAGCFLVWLLWTEPQPQPQRWTGPQELFHWSREAFSNRLHCAVCFPGFHHDFRLPQ